MRRYVCGVALAIVLAGNSLAADARKIVIPTAPVLKVAAAQILTGSPEAPLVAGAGVARNSKGHYYIYQRGVHALIEFDQNDKMVRDFPNIPMKRSHGLRIDAADNLWLLDVADHVVMKVSPAGEIL